MTILFFLLLACYLLAFLARWSLSYIYLKKGNQKQTDIFDERLYTVVQPILSGDPRLKEDLLGNLRQTEELTFFWLIDRSDQEAQRVAADICQEPSYQKRIRIFLMEDVPQGINPKSFKIAQIIDQLESPYMIVLDDDSVINFSQMSQISQYQGQEAILTGIPYNHERSNFWSKLIAAFVNGNSFITYFTMAQLGANHSINGMFYILPVELARKHRIFEQIKDFLCDDLAVANCLNEQGIPIIQTRVTCNVRTTIQSARQYGLQMKRWLLFTSIYMRQYLDFQLMLLIVLPSCLPFFLLLLGAVLGWPYLSLALLAVLFKALWMYGYRRLVLSGQNLMDEIVYEVLNDLVLPLIFLYVLLTPPVINWRGRQIRVTDGKIRYE